MSWWRRDPSLWARSPLHRYAQRVLRDHEAALRTRCFSRSPSNTAQHQDHDSTRRPDGMTDQEWAQLQRYRKWRRLLQEHPYKGLFGSSEDMLRGKGLTDWEWVYKTFPKWMLQEMNPQEPSEKGSSVDNKGNGRSFGDRSEAKAQAAKQSPVERDPSFAQPVIRTTHYERDEFGIVSQSDLRRPADASHVKMVSKPQGRDIATPDAKENNSPEAEVPKADLPLSMPGSNDPPSIGKSSQDAAATAKEASNRESSFIDVFLADEPEVYDRDLGNSKSWRQTALQRRGAPNLVAESRAVPPSDTNPSTEVTSSTLAAPNAITIPSSQALVDNYPYPRSTSTASAITVEHTPEPVRQDMQSAQAVEGHDPQSAHPVHAPSTSKKLRKLPEDDIDFLSADEIRAAMGRRTSVLKSSMGKEQARKRLEVGYATAQPKALDDTVEGHVLNNYYVRRTQQEFERAQAATEFPETERAIPSSNKPRPAPVQMESSIDRMRRWIEEGGTSLAKHFWQDPIEAGAPSEADLQFAKQMAGLAKGRHAREHISDDLETDLPMCKGLLERLKNDEKRVEHAAFLLRTPRKIVHGTEISKNLRTIRERRLRNTYERTEKQFESACQMLRDLDAETIKKATNAFKRRLGIASRILHKNHTLTRMLTWGAQARLDEPDLERSKAELYSEILTRLATLRDTQLALTRLMDHAIQTFGVSYKSVDEALSRPASSGVISEHEAAVAGETAPAKTAGAKFLADTAVAARLTDEIQSQKAAMQGLSDDGYARAPKQTPRKSFEESNPLAHSLFRPFSLQFESLSKKTDEKEAADRVKEALKQKAGDKKLVQEVRSAYEDIYGPITVEHRQPLQTGQPMSNVGSDEKPFEMLKEDPLNVETTAVHAETCPADGATASTTLKTESMMKGTEVSPDNAVPSSIRAASCENVPAVPIAAEATNEIPQDTVAKEESSTTPSPISFPENATDAVSTTADLPTHYTILVHDPQTDTLSITTSTSGPPRDTSPTLPIHQALSTLKAPAKFIPYITPGLEVVNAKRHMLVLRDALDETSSTRGFETVRAQSSVETPTESASSHVNPIDGTSRLSPTGYSGVEQSREQLEKGFDERRQAAAATEAARSKKSTAQARDEEVPKKRRGGVGGVVKTAIWASAVCYIVGVTAEVLR